MICDVTGKGEYKLIIGNDSIILAQPLLKKDVGEKRIQEIQPQEPTIEPDDLEKDWKKTK